MMKDVNDGENLEFKQISLHESILIHAYHLFAWKIVFFFVAYTSLTLSKNARFANVWIACSYHRQQQISVQNTPSSSWLESDYNSNIEMSKMRHSQNENNAEKSYTFRCIFVTSEFVSIETT